MRTDLFDFDLPQERIALRPIAPRDAARLLVVRPSVAVQKFALPSSESGSELLNQSHTSKPSSASVPLNPKFANERAAKSSELRIRDTSERVLCCRKA